MEGNMSENTNYPAQLSVKYSNTSNRVTVFFAYF